MSLETTTVLRASTLLVHQDLAAGSHVLSSLGGSLVLSSLQTDHGLSGLHLFLGELTLALIGGLGSQERSLELGVLVQLAAEGEDGVGHLGNVLLLVQVDGLEHVNIIDTVVLQGLLEVVDVLHQLELSSGLVDLGDRSGHQDVHQAAQDSSVLEHILVGDSSGELGSQNGLNPSLGLGILNGIALAGDLRETR